MARKRAKLPNKMILKLGFAFYGNRFFKKKLRLIDDGALRNIPQPYILMANHASYADVFSVVKMAQPSTVNIVASKSQFAAFGNILYSLGVLSKRQFTVDVPLVKDITTVLEMGGSVALFPEGKLSVDGTTGEIKPAVAKLVKMFKVPLVTVKFSGNYLFKPRWAKDSRFVDVTSEVKVLGSDDVAAMSVEELHQYIVDNLSHDDYQYQLDNKIAITSPTLATGLENILFYCPACGELFNIEGHGDTLHCLHCGNSSRMNQYGQLSGHFGSVKEWYTAQHRFVGDEIDSGSYYVDVRCTAEVQRGNRFSKIGGYCGFVHDSSGIKLTLPDGETLTWAANSMYTLSFNDKYIFLPTPKATYRVSFGNVKGMTTYINIAVEEMYKSDVGA
jgi:hypothetical protein